MKISVIQCSPKGEKSSCLRLAQAFVDGMGESAEYILLSRMDIRPCMGCYACWHQTPGHCVQRDDVAEILTKIDCADLVIWNTPLYSYGFPSAAKAVIDRMLPLSCPTQTVAADGNTEHPARHAHVAKFMLIAGCGFPNIEHNFEPLLLQFEYLFRKKDFPRILCAEAPMLTVPEAASLAEAYLDLVRTAGREYAADGYIHADTQAKLDRPMLDPNIYRAICSGQKP